MPKLPPYGRSVAGDEDVLWVFAGFFEQAIQYLKHRHSGTMGIYLWEDPQNYRWPVKDREVIVFCWLDPKDPYLKDLALALFSYGAKNVYIRNVQFAQQINYRRS